MRPDDRVDPLSGDTKQPSDFLNAHEFVVHRVPTLPLSTDNRPARGRVGVPLPRRSVRDTERTMLADTWTSADYRFEDALSKVWTLLDREDKRDVECGDRLLGDRLIAVNRLAD